MSARRCAVCGCRIAGADYCRTHKFVIRRAWRRVKDESLVIDQAGGNWWVWDAHGNVLVEGQPRKELALIALAGGEID